MPRLLEPLLIQTITERFRSLNVVVSSGATPTLTAPIKAVPTATSSSLVIPAIGSSGVIRAASLTPTVSIAIPRATVPASTPLVQPASRSAADLQMQTQVSDEITKYIAGISHAIVVAHDNWRQRAFLKGVQINGVTAMGGSVTGPSLAESLIPFGPASGMWNNAAAYTAAIGNGLASAWREWEQSIRVPGLAWYPSFAAVPAPQAPPTPNIPTPLNQLGMTLGFLSSDYLKTVITQKIAKAGPYADPLFTSVADGFSKVVSSWMATQVVTGVMGRGPAPVFAPPYVPVGVVVGGTIVEAAPHFAS
ncbi:MAG TPA: hypothetical protein VGM82_10635 [Gemmatimonadaceae bacterium]